MKYDVYLENDDAERIMVRGKDITLDDGEWLITKTLEEWLDLAIEEHKKIAAASKSESYQI